VIANSSTSGHDAKPQSISNSTGEQTPSGEVSIAEEQLIRAKAAHEVAIGRIKKVDQVILYRRVRLWAAQRGLASWVWALIAGSLAALVFTVILIIIFGAGLMLVFFGLLIAYAIFGGGVLWLLRDVEGEYPGNRIHTRTGQLALAHEERLAAIENARKKSEIEDKAKQALESIKQRLQSEAQKLQLEGNRLLSIDPGRLYPDEFERYVASIFTHLGFTVESVGQNGDQGVDVIACKGTLRLAIQAKRYLGAVGNAAVQEVYAGMAHHKCHRCIVATNSDFTSSAIALAQSTGCLLIGGDKIASLIRGEISF
jgi:hypothetical protein